MDKNLPYHIKRSNSTIVSSHRSTIPNLHEKDEIKATVLIIDLTVPVYFNSVFTTKI